MTPINIPKPTIIKTQVGNALKSRSASNRANQTIVKNEAAEEKAQIKTELKIKVEEDWVLSMHCRAGLSMSAQVSAARS